MEQSGGKVGPKVPLQGAYGCIVAPPIPCASGYIPSSATPQNIMKVGKRTGIEEEIAAARLITRIPLNRLYYVVAKGEACSLAQGAIQGRDELKECSAIADSRLTEILAFRMKKGGEYTLSKYNANLRQFNIHRFFQHLIEAGALLTLHGIVHRDLHSENVIIDPQGTPRLIDFGQFARYRETPSKYNNDPPRFSQMPPDLNMMLAIGNPRQPLNVLLGEMWEVKPIMKTIAAVLGVSAAQIRTKAMKFAAEDEAYKGRSYDAWWSAYWSKYDSWAIGALIAEQLRQYMKFIQFEENEHYKVNKGRIMNTLRGLLDIDPRSRLDLIEALAIWNPKSRVLQKYCMKWLLRRRRDRAADEATAAGIV